jgi:hypothetical protein
MQHFKQNQLLTEIGFCSVSKIDGTFGLFEDTSNMHVLGKPISLNVIATACEPPLPTDPIKQRSELLRSIYEASGVQVPESMIALV